MLRIYVAGPLTKPAGFEMPNIRSAIDVGQTLFKLGFAPFIPHLNELWYLVYPQNTYEEFLTWDRAWIAACGAIFRIPGYSEGADREIEFAKTLGIPVFYDVSALVEWRERTRGLRFPPEGLQCCLCDTAIESIVESGERPKFEYPGIAICFNDGPIQVISSAVCLPCHATAEAPDGE